jgi:hypothetical protein
VAFYPFVSLMIASIRSNDRLHATLPFKL